ncbi:hypothetical protein SLEP1_g25645 [Rubroshorea leprosula]|uniref:Uncharacterized protein n=1 Tax=Rubroshorea leprosula TaxID=152421 RepID=A0AAV5JMP2_9ROSI|nr:hypothetical protein SLEP1_g25645 [Rubroshorea leprosula]
MEIVNIGEEEFVRTLLVKERANPDDEECKRHDQNAAFMVVFSTLVAASLWIGYSSLAETGIVDDLGISMVEVGLL